MDVALSGVVGLVLGGLLTWLILHAVERSRHPIDTLATDIEVMVVTPELKRALAQVGGAAAVIGPHDEVLHSTVSARSMNIVRGSRIIEETVLEIVRESRQRSTELCRDIDVPGTATGRTAQHLTVRVGPLDAHGNIVLVVDDRAPLLRVEQTRRDFVANISHELKTPIGAIAILSEAVEGAADDPEAVRHFAGRLNKETARVSEMVSQIINLSRLQSDQPMMTPQQVDVCHVLADAVERNRELADSREVNLVVKAEPDLEIQGDPAQLTDAVSNLIHNAIVYSNPRARVAVSSRLVHDVDGDRADIAVADNGIGITDEDQRRIFERFYRVDYARSRDNGGTGLGLSLVKHIAQAHGGSVDVWSKVGQGSTFTLSIPLPSLEFDDEDPDGLADAHDSSITSKKDQS
ncbi:MAG: ATP-binding protein [Cutibacterium granulosum]|uniref:sensor histidine kinase n=1 Tax=Cutibacterium granulosum TaxID=33011 RepID=UPI002B23965D|nr:ATP-binding protein [Cutibacterium granulosum]MEA5634753.1 ATP-binding protein [Cutibacterium granulosum]MEA5645693.1 ATP-binding protein [Cutibacterium granulosum]MEA5649204.1 ATP-binding protein [Cutibacterium granulosum]MEA5650254.1 ATP-binding protein [Cutibacterium granulosum]MEA5653936.1 ATP-binding protein [Cutibacterium granulosum]